MTILHWDTKSNYHSFGHFTSVDEFNTTNTLPLARQLQDTSRINYYNDYLHNVLLAIKSFGTRPIKQFDFFLRLCEIIFLRWGLRLKFTSTLWGTNPICVGCRGPYWAQRNRGMILYDGWMSFNIMLSWVPTSINDSI